MTSIRVALLVMFAGLLLFGLGFASTVSIAAQAVYAHNGSAAAGANVTMYKAYVLYDGGPNPPSFVRIAAASVLANSTGHFNLSFDNATPAMCGGPPTPPCRMSPLLFDFKAMFFESSHIKYISNTMPTLPYAELSNAITTLSNSNLPIGVLPATELFITAVNATGSATTFGYFLKDKSYGMDMGNSQNTTNASIYLVSSRNYTLQLFRMGSGPGDPGAFPRTVVISASNLTSHAVNNQFNYTANFSDAISYASGNLSATGNSTAVTFTNILFYPLIDGEFFFGPNGRPMNVVQYNASDFGPGLNINQSPGNYTASLISSAGTGLSYMMLAIGTDGTNYYGAFQNITMISGQNVSINLALRRMKGNDLITNYTDDMNTSKFVVTLIDNQTGQPVTQNTGFLHLGVSDFNGATLISFSLNVEANSTGSFIFPLINQSNVTYQLFTMGRPPRKGALNTSGNSTSLMLKGLEFDSPDGASFGAIEVQFYHSNSTCNVPEPAASCILTNFSAGGPVNGFNPLGFTLAGINISMRINNHQSGVVVHLNNVDLIASGPPTASFDNQSTLNQSGAQLEEARRIGSFAPRVFSNAFVGMRLNNQTDPSRTVRVLITSLFNDEWGSIWNSTANPGGTNVPSEFADYNQSLFNQTAGGVLCNTTDPNSMCYLSLNSSLGGVWIWVRVPHFSGTTQTLIGNGYEPFNLTLSKNDSSDPVQNATQLNYTIFYNNTGNGSAYNVTFVETYSNETNYVTASPAPTTGNNQWYIGTVAPNQSGTINITVFVNATSLPTQLLNTVFVTARNGTGSESNTTFNTTTNVSAPPNCPIINTSGIYTMNNSFSGAPNNISGIITCVYINASNIVFDCNGYSINNNGTANAMAITAGAVTPFTNITVKNCALINGYSNAVFFDSVNSSTIYNVTATNFSTYGFNLQSSLNNNISSNYLYNSSGRGMQIYLSHNNTFTGNVMNNNSYDSMLFVGSSNNTVIGNRVITASSGYTLRSGSSNNTFDSNNASGCISYCFMLWYFTASNNNNTFIRNTVTSSNQGFYSDQNNSGNIFTLNNVSADQYGFILQSSNSNTLSNNRVTLTSAAGSGIYLGGSVATSVSGSTITGPASPTTTYGIRLSDANSSVIFNNVQYGLSEGISVVSGAYNNFTNNTAYNSVMGLHSEMCLGCNYTATTAYGNTVGIDLRSTSAGTVTGMLWDSVVYNNTLDFQVTKTLGSLTYNATNVTFRNPSGGAANSTVMDINSTMSTEQYSMSWAQSIPLPQDYSSFANKFVRANVATGPASIGSTVWRWTDAESGPYNESKFELWKYNATGWFNVSGITRNTTANTLSVNSLALVDADVFAILMINDTTPPSVTLNFPPEGYSTNATTLDLNFTTIDALSPPMNCTLFINGTANATNGSVSSGVMTNFTVAFASGAYSWYVRCNDTNGNSNVSETRNFTVDNVAPSISLSSPANAYYGNNTQLSFVFNATDDFRPTLNCSVRIDGAVAGTNSTVTSGALTTMTLAVSGGAHSWNVTCSDGLNSNTSATRSYYLDQTPPVISVSFPSNNYNDPTEAPVAIIFNFTVSDENSTTLNCTFYLDDIANYTNNTVANGTRLELNRTISVGAHTWAVSCKDQANNSASVSLNLRIGPQPLPPSGGDTTKAFSINASIACPGDYVDVYAYSSAGALYGAAIRVVKISPYEGLITQGSTGSSGLYRLQLASSGTYAFTATLPGYRPAEAVNVVFTTCTVAQPPSPPSGGNITTPQPPLGGDRDAHGCIPSAGYSWCEQKQKCLRPWEEECSEPPVIDPNIRLAEDAISAAQSAITQSQSQSKDVSAATSKLAQAQSAFASGDYTEAKRLADEARQLAFNAAGRQQPPVTPQVVPVPVAPEEQPKGLDPLLLVLGIVIFVVVIGAGVASYVLFGQKKQGGYKK